MSVKEQLVNYAKINIVQKIAVASMALSSVSDYFFSRVYVNCSMILCANPFNCSGSVLSMFKPSCIPCCILRFTLLNRYVIRSNATVKTKRQLKKKRQQVKTSAFSLDLGLDL